jgi:hypothetical protein
MELDDASNVLVSVFHEFLGHHPVGIFEALHSSFMNKVPSVFKKLSPELLEALELALARKWNNPHRWDEFFYLYGQAAHKWRDEQNPDLTYGDLLLAVERWVKSTNILEVNLYSGFTRQSVINAQTRLIDSALALAKKMDETNPHKFLH